MSKITAVIYSFLKIVLLLGFVFLFGRAWYMRPKIQLEAQFTEELLSRPTAMSFHPQLKNRVLVSEKEGWLRWGDLGQKRLGGVALDLSGEVTATRLEDGLLNVVFDPNYPQKPYLYLYYTVLGQEPKQRENVLSRFTVRVDEKDDFIVDASSKLEILRLNNPRYDHNGGGLAFGPNNFLYVSVGDGQDWKNQISYLQSRKKLLGVILRIDVSRSSERERYKIPPDNPFVASKDGSLGEIWAYGFRNPWRINFDRKETGALYVGDVGQSSQEEFNRVKKGQNYGWPIVEGQLCFAETKCDQEKFQRPLGSFSKTWMRSIIGGFVYRGDSIEFLKGRYVFADYYRGLFSTALPKSFNRYKTVTIPQFLLPKSLSPDPKVKGRSLVFNSLSEDLDGELYALSYWGNVYKLKASSWNEALLDFIYTVTAFW